MAAIDPSASASALLAQMKAMRTAAEAGVRTDQAGAPANADFAALMRHYVDQVNSTQQKAASLSASFESGAPDVKLLDVMVSMQKSRIAFEALVQVRNRFLSAYQEIMSMQV